MYRLSLPVVSNAGLICVIGHVKRSQYLLLGVCTILVSEYQQGLQAISLNRADSLQYFSVACGRVRW